MHRYLIALVVFGLFAGCMPDRDVNRGSKSAIEPAAQPHAPLLPMAGAVRQPHGSFASSADRGMLFAYDRSRKVRQSGAYTSYPVDLSEAHALRAISTREMKLTAPDGTPIRLRYERHIEHPDGNWSWIGRDAEGTDAVVTFGEKAAFGSIPYQGHPALRFTLDNGRSWLVATDPSKATDAMTLSGKQDYLVPPALADAVIQQRHSTATQGMETAGAETASATTVDVVLGYTNGFAASLGGQSQAVTRLTNMVDITSQAYANSQIAVQLRLTGTVQVNYPDATKNRTALEELTGYRSGSIPVPAALQPLRAARDQFGGDLVSLVRKFQTPENEGCGIAWLLGGGGNAIDASDATFAYSVVSDGADVSESDGKTYFCREETLAHELGHSMGQTHNAEDSTTTGAHPYSHGYREASGNGFYTVMAYRLTDSNQFGIRYFANPNIAYQGRPTGTSNADNARSLKQTMPIVATFRNAVVESQPAGPAPSLVDSGSQDINGDGMADLLWRYDLNTYWAYWLMVGATKVGGATYAVGPDWRVVATGDFRGDGMLDVIWTDGTSMQMWDGNVAGFTGAVMQDYSVGWRVVAVGDFNGDGKSDLLWRNDADTSLGLWEMNGPDVIGSAGYDASSAWRILGTGDLSGDGRLDIVWTNGTQMQAWIGSGPRTFSGASMQDYPLGWDLAGVGDMDGDGRSDLFWRHPAGGYFVYWLMQGATRVYGATFNVSPEWRVQQTGDFNGDRKVDVVWTNGTTMQLWTSTGYAFGGTNMPAYPSGWSVIRR